MPQYVRVMLSKRAGLASGGREAHNPIGHFHGGFARFETLHLPFQFEDLLQGGPIREILQHLVGRHSNSRGQKILP